MSASHPPPADVVPPAPDAAAPADPTINFPAETTGHRLHYNAFAHWLAQFAPARTPERARSVDEDADIEADASADADAGAAVSTGEAALVIRPA